MDFYFDHCWLYNRKLFRCLEELGTNGAAAGRMLWLNFSFIKTIAPVLRVSDFLCSFWILLIGFLRSVFFRSFYLKFIKFIEAEFLSLKSMTYYQPCVGAPMPTQIKFYREYRWDIVIKSATIQALPLWRGQKEDLGPSGWGRRV